MKKFTRYLGGFMAVFLSMSSFQALADAPNKVDVYNFVRAETDMTMHRYNKNGGFANFFHIRTPVTIDKQDVIRMNRDTLYSFAVFDLNSPVTIHKKDSDGRFQSVLVINQDHSMLPVIHGAGDIVLTKEKVGTRYVIVVVRTFADPADPEDIKAAHLAQDSLTFTQEDKGKFEVELWDEESLSTIRDAINVLGNASIKDASGLFGDASKLDPISHLMGTAYGWGGNPKEAAMYDVVVPEKNDGTTPYIVSVIDVPVDGFWSITVYNKDGFMEKNTLDAYSFNGVTAKKDSDGSITIHFGGDESSNNYLPITEDWTYVVRMYQPGEEIINRTWKFPKAKISK